MPRVARRIPLHIALRVRLCKQRLSSKLSSTSQTINPYNHHVLLRPHAPAMYGNICHDAWDLCETVGKSIPCGALHRLPGRCLDLPTYYETV